MKDASPQPIQLKNYAQPDFWIPTVELHFNLDEEKTLVRATLTLDRNLDQPGSANAPLVLNGEHVKLLSVKIDGRPLDPTHYQTTATHLRIDQVPNRFQLETVVEIEPQKNLSCEGLYKSKGMFCTQCEAESFRRITYFLDRPDVMSTYTVTIEAEKAKYPLLLSNGNPTGQRDLGNGRHEAVWKDPHRKPCYLFALVAGDLGVLEDTFTTRSGREVKLQIFARHGLQDRCQYAMDSLKWSMKWDEDTYGLEYDLDIFMIVVAEDFNMGAMENKGLNVFNANYVLANPETATDTDYDGILAVVGHEYFHNWTGNRVTCRDWFQLSLKEGLTVFRDQRFSSDLGSEAVNRIEDVMRLRTHQFAEDAGPMAHPIRPQSYISIDNFYTLTVYEKGAEVIRMIETILGRDGFRKGMDLYFKRHDGNAVTTEDFVAAMADANGVDLTQFRDAWYNQAGTPLLRVSTEHDASKETYSIAIEQSSSPSPGQVTKRPYHIPVAVGLVGKDGKDLSLQLVNGDRRSSGTGATTEILHLRESKQTFVFSNVKERPVLSLLRSFSAPVKTEYDFTDDELAFLMAHDSNDFARWEAAQTLSVRVVKDMVDHIRASGAGAFPNPSKIVDALGPILADAKMDPAFKSYMLLFPAEQYLAQFFSVVDVDAIHVAREHILKSIAKTHAKVVRAIYDELAAKGTEGQDPKMSGRRSLRNRLLEFICLEDSAEVLELAAKQRREAKNMTDELGALTALNRSTSPLRERELKAFHEKWKNEPLVLNKWLSIQAIAPKQDVLAEVKRLATTDAFDKNNPNKIYSLYVAFARFNHVRFHDPSGEAYKFIADQVLDIDGRNPQVASRVVGAFNQWRQLDSHRQNLIRNELQRIVKTPGLSSNVFEIVSKTLNA